MTRIFATLITTACLCFLSRCQSWVHSAAANETQTTDSATAESSNFRAADASGDKPDRSTASAKTKDASSPQRLALLNRVCPYLGDPIHPDYVVEYKNYRLGFCCPGCAAGFRAADATDQDTLFRELLALAQKKASR